VICCILFQSDSSSLLDRADRGRVTGSEKGRQVKSAAASPMDKRDSVAIGDGKISPAAVDPFEGQHPRINDPGSFDQVRRRDPSRGTFGRRANFLIPLSARLDRMCPRREPSRQSLEIETPVKRFDVTDRVSGRSCSSW
jgi:hypothetical protein